MFHIFYYFSIFTEYPYPNYILAQKPVEPECRVDGDCPSKHACIDQRCQNPCIVRNPCSGAQTCVVTDSLPIRTVGCVCPDGSVSGTHGDCVKGNPGRLNLLFLIIRFFFAFNYGAHIEIRIYNV